LQTLLDAAEIPHQPKTMETPLSKNDINTFNKHVRQDLKLKSTEVSKNEFVEISSGYVYQG